MFTIVTLIVIPIATPLTPSVDQTELGYGIRRDLGGVAV